MRSLELCVQPNRQHPQLHWLEVNPYASREDADAQQIKLRHRDANGPFAEKMTQELVNRCEGLGLTYGFKDKYIMAQNEALGRRFSLGRTELGRIVTATEGAIQWNNATDSDNRISHGH